MNSVGTKFETHPELAPLLVGFCCFLGILLMKARWYLEIDDHFHSHLYSSPAIKGSWRD
jgi:hypothetical protein